MDDIILKIKDCVSESINEFVIVEGKKDKASLERLGFKNIVTLDGPLYLVAERVIQKGIGSVILLTDLDAEGKRLYSSLKSSFEKNGVKVDDKLRNLLFQSQLRQIEGLDTYLENHS